MNKNTIIAFLIILLSIQFFTSRFYYEKVLRKPYPFSKKREVVREQKREEIEMPQQKIREKPTEIIEKDILFDVSEIKTKEDLDTVKIDTIWIETDKLICAISELGGRIISLKTKEYAYSKANKEEKDEYIELIPEGEIGGANLQINEINFDDKIFKYNDDKKNFDLKGEEKLSLKLMHTLEENKILTKKYTFFNGTYKIGYEVISDELDGKNVTVGWKCGIDESEKSVGRSAQFDQIKIHLFDGKSVEHISVKKESKEERTGYYQWIGITSKYFLVAFVPDSIRDADISIEAYEIKDKDKKNKKVKKMNYKIISKRFASGTKESYWLYAGPSKLTEMKKYNIGLQKVLFRGYRWFFWADKWFPAVCEFVLWLLIQLQKVVIDYGIVIILLTIILRIVTYPLTQSSMKSMNKMKEIQPKINKVREKYKGNPKAMNQKIMEFYKKEGVNPLGGMGGCLPMLLQMPIMIALFIVLRKAIELRGQRTFLIPWIKDLSQAEILFPLGFNIPLYGSNVALLPIIMAVLMYFQNKATIKDPNQKAMIYMMPVMMLVLFNNFPSGLCLYFTFSTALQVLQQGFMDRMKKLRKSTQIGVKR